MIETSCHHHHHRLYIHTYIQLLIQVLYWSVELERERKKMGTGPRVLLYLWMCGIRKVFLFSFFAVISSSCVYRSGTNFVSVWIFQRARSVELERIRWSKPAMEKKITVIILIKSNFEHANTRMLIKSWITMNSHNHHSSSIPWHL